MTDGFFPESLRNLTDEELRTMKDRSYWRAARAWQDARQSGLTNAAIHLLSESAQSEEDFWHSLQLEYLRRLDAKKEVPA
mgnify:CR=1 FL=1